MELFTTKLPMEVEDVSRASSDTKTRVSVGKSVKISSDAKTTVAVDNSNARTSVGMAETGSVSSGAKIAVLLGNSVAVISSMGTKSRVSLAGNVTDIDLVVASAGADTVVAGVGVIEIQLVRLTTIKNALQNITNRGAQDFSMFDIACLLCSVSNDWTSLKRSIF